MKEIPPVEVSISVSLGVAEAFSLFTDGIGTWWPMQTHSVGGDRAVDVAIEGREGGELYELTSAGEKHIWGTILLWDPPNRVGFTWHPGRDVDYATEVEVTFRPAGGMTEVSLRHRGWEKLREKAEEIRANYQSGWGDLVGRRYREAAERERAESA